MEPLLVAVLIVMTLRMTSGDDDSCEIHPPFKTKQTSADFLAKPSWIDGGMLYDEESVFVRRRHCPIRVRVDEESSKENTMRNGSHSKETNTKKNNSHRKLKGSKRKRKKEKRKRFRKKKKNNQHSKKNR